MPKGRKQRLGKGLEALFAQGSDDTSDQIAMVEVDRIRPSPFQPRNRFDPERLEELAASIRSYGMIQPVLLSEDDDLMGRYQLVAGERRWRAAELADLDEIPAIIRSFSSEERAEIALIENLQREDLSVIEEAGAYRQLIEEFDLTQAEVAERIGRSRSQVANTLRLLQLPEAVQTRLERGELTMGHAKVLVAVDDSGIQKELVDRILAEGLTVRQVEAAVRKLRQKGDSTARDEKAEGAAEERKNERRDPQIDFLENRLRQRLGTKVRIEHKGDRGRILIRYYDTDDLNRILEYMGLLAMDD